MATDSEKRNALDALLDNMHAWARERDPEVVPRRSDAIDVDSRLFILGEAYAKDHVRKTGVNWIRRDDNIGPAGRLVPATHPTSSRPSAPHTVCHPTFAHTDDLEFTSVRD
jgi:hypothetical protein